MKLSDFIRDNIEAILQEWEQFADTIQPKAGAMDKKALRDHAELMLQDTADDLDSLESEPGQPEKSGGRNLESIIVSAASDHGTERMRSGFGIVALLSEYRNLRSTILRLWGEYRTEKTLYDDVVRFNQSLDEQIFEAVCSFSAESDRQKRLFDTVLSSDHGYILDLDGKFVYANKPMLQVLNITLDELVGKSHLDLNSSTAAEIQNNVKQVIRTAEKLLGEVKYSLPSGEERYYEYVFTPVFDKEKKIEAVAATERDVTDRKRAIAALRASQEQLLAVNAELERRVEQRTLELQKTQLQYLHAGKLSAIGNLSASIAHEFNNPLQGVMTVLKGLMNVEVLEEENRKLLNLAMGESERMKNLIRSLQQFNRPSSGKKVFIDVHASIESMLLLCNGDFKNKGISVVLEYAERLPQILAVPDQMKQVFLNLLINAVDACAHNDGVITVCTCHDEKRVAVAIKDNCVGIEPEKLDLIFQPFYTTKRKKKGTGLGLSICHGIIQDHHGEIRVESQPGEGSTFTVLLPIDGGSSPRFQNNS